VVTFTSVIAAWKQQSNGEKAEQCLECMMARGLKPNMVTCHCMVAAWAKRGNATKAQQHLECMVNKHHVNPSQKTLKAVLTELAKQGDVENFGLCLGRLSGRGSDYVEVMKQRLAELMNRFPDGLPSKGTLRHIVDDHRCRAFKKGNCSTGKDCHFSHASHKRRSPRCRQRAAQKRG